MTTLEPRPGHVVAMTELPICDLCGSRPATWDAPMAAGPWAYMCNDCRWECGCFPVTTGVGIGQRLVLIGV